MAAEGRTPAEQEPVAIDPVTLRFRAPQLESEFRTDYFRQNLGNIRFAFLSGVALWVMWGFVINPYLLAVADKSFDLWMRLGVFIPLLLIGVGLTFTRWFERNWEWVTTVIVTVTILLWVFYNSQVLTVPADYGYVGLILITAFTHTLLRQRFVLVVLTTAIAVATYIPFAVWAVYIFGVKTMLATLYLTTFSVLWAVAAYRLEKSSRVLFLRERQLDSERQRSDSLLLNVLPRVIIDRLKSGTDRAHVAEAFDEVSVFFADAVNSTEQAAKISPDAFADTLDRLFRMFDAVADRYRMEKIKTIGDAYMAVGGAPVPMKDHAEAAANMALDVLEHGSRVRWPSGDPVVVRVGVATGPAVAGVIGQRKFAYDLWGDTVNLAARLESTCEPGRILLSERTAELLEDRFELGPLHVIDLKGKGPTPVRLLLGRRSEVPVSTAS
ncbi:MAG: adenylate/guanylate cyclase domain-containing protein [Actinomycetota bacterium]